MMRFFVLLLLFLPLSACASFKHGTPTPPTQCSNFPGYADGCTGSQSAGIFQTPDLFTYGAQSSQTWATTHHPQLWNLTGVDFPVGYNPALLVNDPATSPLPQGCQYFANGTDNYVGPMVYCNKDANNLTPVNPSFLGFDFYKNGVCTFLKLNKNTVGRITIRNSRFKFAGGCQTANPANLINIVSGAVVDIDFEYNEVDGSCPLGPVGVCAGTGLGAGLSLNQAGLPAAFANATMKYNYVHDMPAVPWASNGAYTHFVDDFNVYAGFTQSATGAHGAVWPTINSDGSSGTTLEHCFNTVVITKYGQAPNGGITTVFSALSAHPGGAKALGVSYGDINICNNSIVTNLIGGAGGTLSGSYALSYFSYLKSVGTAEVVNNWVDPTGFNSCSVNLGGAFEITGTVDDGQGNAGRLLTVTSVPNGNIWPSFTTPQPAIEYFKGSGIAVVALLPFGTPDPRTGIPTTGTGGVGTYVLAAVRGPLTTPAGDKTWETVNTPITGGVTFSGNTSLVTNQPITNGSGDNDGSGQWGGSCPGHG